MTVPTPSLERSEPQVSLTAASTRVSILGQLSVHVDGVERTPTGRRERHVLTLLAIHRTVTSEQFIEALWPAPPPTARTSLHVAIGRLRTLIDPSSITRSGTSYRLEPTVEVDYDEFSERIESDDPADWERIIALTSRRVLDDLLDDRDILAFARRVQRYRRRACILLARHHLETLGDPYRALDLLEREALDDPDDPVMSDLVARARDQVRTDR